MAEASFKDQFMIKLPKASPLASRMIVVVIATICGVYICSICLIQIGSQTDPNMKLFEEESCATSRINPLEPPLLHYPRPRTYSRDECGGNPVRFFVIVSMQRSGSGWFETLLNSHTNVSSNGEILGRKNRRENITLILQALDTVYDLDWFSSASKNECSAAVGFKWMLNQGLMEYHKEIAEYFNKRGVSVIFLFRRNMLRRIVSLLANSYDRNYKLLNGTHKSHVHSLEEAHALSTYKPYINSTSLISQLSDMEKSAEEALKYFNCTRHIILYYEDVIRNWTKLVDVQDFLGVPRMKLRSRQVKIHKGPLHELIKNWDDVKKKLNGTAYEHFLHADY